jgi:hypothetical protein
VDGLTIRATDVNGKMVYWLRLIVSVSVRTVPNSSLGVSEDSEYLLFNRNFSSNQL